MQNYHTYIIPERPHLPHVAHLHPVRSAGGQCVVQHTRRRLPRPSERVRDQLPVREHAAGGLRGR